MLSISVVHFHLLLHHLPDFLIIGAFLEIFCRLKINGAVYVRWGEHAQDYLQDITDFLVRHPLLLSQHLFTDLSISDVWMVDRCLELEMGKWEWECLWKINVKDEFSLLKRCVHWTLDRYLPMEQTLFLFWLYAPNLWDNQYLLVISLTSLSYFSSLFILFSSYQILIKDFANYCWVINHIFSNKECYNFQSFH